MKGKSATCPGDDEARERRSMSREVSKQCCDLVALGLGDLRVETPQKFTGRRIEGFEELRQSIWHTPNFETEARQT